MAAACRRSRAQIYLELGMPGEGEEAAREAAGTFEQEGMAQDAALCRLEEGRARLAAGKPEEARRHILEAARFFRRRRIRPRAAHALLLEAECLLRAGRARQAEGFAARAGATFREMAMADAESQARRIRAEALLLRGRPGEAERVLAPALSRRRVRLLGGGMDSWALAGRIARARGRVREAASRLDHAAALLEEQRRLIPGAELRARAFERQVRVYHERIALELETGRPRLDRLFALCEAARARGFRDRAARATGLRDRASRATGARSDSGGAGRRPPAPAGDPARNGGARLAADRSLLGSWTRRLEEAEMAGEGASNTSAVSRLRRKVMALERSILQKMRAGEYGQEDGGEIERVASLETTSERLAPDEALVSWFVAGGRVAACVVRPSGAALRLLPAPPGDLRAMVDQVRFQLDSMSVIPERRNLAFLRRTADDALSRLYDALLAPLEILLPKSGRLILMPHAFLHHVPFECLVSGGEYVDGRYILARIPTAEILGRRSGGAFGREAPHASGRVVISGQVTGGPPSVAREIEAIRRRFPAEELRILTDPTSAEILSALPDSRVLHLSAHGVFRDDNPLFSRLATRDGALFVADLLGTRLAAELAVLSACSSGQAFTGSGDDLSGVAHGFLAAGCERLVAAMWRVHDAAATSWMEAFYEAYSGAARGDAARAAAEAGRAVRREWEHPFYWGGFAVFGA
jgi:CHAT domain-containing protein